jgi:hypothetical protein
MIKRVFQFFIRELRFIRTRYIAKKRFSIRFPGAVHSCKKISSNPAIRPLSEFGFY